jgi:universal stress protein A
MTLKSVKQNHLQKVLRKYCSRKRLREEVKHMFKNILIPTDLSENSKRALDIAVSLDPEKERSITLLHVVEIIEGDDQKEFSEFYKKLRARAKKKMADIAGQYEGRNCSIDSQILIGKRVEEIVRFAYEHDIDLIILASHRINKVEPMEGWATISYRVGILSHCPVLMVK